MSNDKTRDPVTALYTTADFRKDTEEVLTPLHSAGLSTDEIRVVLQARIEKKMEAFLHRPAAFEYGELQKVMVALQAIWGNG